MRSTEMSALELELAGCPVTDCATGEVVGRVKVVVRAPTGGVAQLAIERLEDAWEPDNPVGGSVLGDPLYDGRGALLGWAVGMAESLPLGRMRRLGHADGIPRGTRYLLVRTPSEGEEEWLDSLDLGECEGARGDYMVGQRASCTLLDPAGRTLIRGGEVITSTLLERARSLGLLHRLEATF